MATLVGGVLQTTFAALSFAGAGYLFQKLNKNGYEDEMKRHNKALEDLSRAKELFYENEVKNNDRIRELRRKVMDADADTNQTIKAFELLKRTMTIQFGDRQFSEQPKLSDFYAPGPEMKEYQTLVAGAIGLGVGYLAYRLV